MEDNKVGEKRPYAKPMMETHEPLRNLTAAGSPGGTPDPIPQPYPEPQIAWAARKAGRPSMKVGQPMACQE